MKITVILADDHQVIRQGLRTLIEQQDDMEVVAEASNGRQAVDMCDDLKPDVVVMDVAMPDLNGIEATRQIANECPSTKVLALSMHADKHYAAGMLGAGAAGYVLKDCAFDELAGAIRRVASGRSYLSADIESVVVRDYVERLSGDGGESVFSVLTDREREVLQLVAEGHTTKQIADGLHVSVKTIESHRQNIMDKLEIRSIAELTKYAIREGLTSLEP
ncbi:MAG: response regulator transcription factor [candidate division WS1 bacterium]|jgi:DNA-binding NarL/FixJ family response regulator|nr:response regulator transcription factor [candidate division WS1 bacterium]